MAVWLLIYNRLWDRPDDHHTPAEAVIYNVSTAVTLLLGVACMYGLLHVSALAVSALIIGPGYLQSQLHHRIGFGDYATVAWLAGSIAVVTTSPAPCSHCVAKVAQGLSTIFSQPSCLCLKMS
jgi:hypothetical protein